MCTVLTFAMCADPKVPAALTFGELTVPIVWSHRSLRSCADLSATAIGEPGLTRIQTAWQAHQSLEPSDGYPGSVTAKIADARIELTDFSWSNMTAADGAALGRSYSATLWHEIGHLRTAQASVDAINAEPGFEAPTASAFLAVAKARGEAAVARVTADQAEYDRAAEHGLRQSLLPPPLAGPDTVVVCPSAGGRSR